MYCKSIMPSVLSHKEMFLSLVLPPPFHSNFSMTMIKGEEIDIASYSDGIKPSS